ncbi:hypothetical protein GCM10011492_08870 [Flexivirga endophytica]|uniref:HTH marR-type domain-containing protein n=1 Tax=Flexivirga endophytica TaxID=1849103 RepID=A0A916WP60_9MICO|nr:ROK family transcriptional regulator [Flexivirga endophytica]GGB21174.1 hypothetical protein GCM10011492_08870 [Flexivirga endophytica]GHB58877.1 hypothetical protein GCM10008112_29890 [Flexivirga endophytica]
MASASPDVLRAGTDQRVLELLYDGPRSRAELAAVGGISKPTASESVRRLETRGVVAETGERRHGVGRTATLIGIRADIGVGLAVSIEAGGVRASTHTVSGEIVQEAEVTLPPTHGPRSVAGALGKAVRAVAGSSDHPICAAAVSAADPVRRSDGRLVELPDAPFLVGSLDARRKLSPYVAGEVLVDNDVNWAAGAELSALPERPDFGYLHLGSGLGGAVVSDGEVRRGHHGFVGEIAHVIVPGPSGLAMPITDVFAEMGLRQPNSTAIDLNAVRRAFDDAPASAVLGQALAAVVGAFVALADPSEVIVAGPWGAAALPSLAAALSEGPRPAPLVAATVTDASATGVRDGAVAGLRSWVSAVAAAD